MKGITSTWNSAAVTPVSLKVRKAHSQSDQAVLRSMGMEFFEFAPMDRAKKGAPFSKN